MPDKAKSNAEIPCILLAAGQSQRMGAVNKLLLEFDGVPLICRMVDILYAGGLRSIIVVTGHQKKSIEHALKDKAVDFVFNPHWENGMGSSIAVGIAAVKVSTEGYAICLGDLPYLESTTVKSVCSAFLFQSKDRITLPVMKKRRGHPVLFPSKHKSKLLSLENDHGARQWMLDSEIQEVEVEDSGIWKDVDC